MRLERVIFCKHISHFFPNENTRQQAPREKYNTIGTLLFHHCFLFSRLVMWELQVEDPLHEHLCVAVKIQGVRVIDDCVVRVWIQQHRHVAPSGTHLYIISATQTLTVL